MNPFAWTYVRSLHLLQSSRECLWLVTLLLWDANFSQLQHSMDNRLPLEFVAAIASVAAVTLATASTTKFSITSSSTMSTSTISPANNFIWMNYEIPSQVIQVSSDFINYLHQWNVLEIKAQLLLWGIRLYGKYHMKKKLWSFMYL